jgi:hypothetical protein
MDKGKYFIDMDGVIYRIFSSENHNFPGNLHLSENRVSVVDEEGCEIEEYVLWNSLLELAKAIESNE